MVKSILTVTLYLLFTHLIPGIQVNSNIINTGRQRSVCVFVHLGLDLDNEMKCVRCYPTKTHRYRFAFGVIDSAAAAVAVAAVVGTAFLVSSFSRMSHTSRELLLLFAAMISIYLTNYCRAGCSLHHFGCAFFLWNVSTPSIFSFRVLPQRLKTNALSRQPKPNQWRRILDSNHISLDVARKECSNAFIMNFACWCLPQF